MKTKLFLITLLIASVFQFNSCSSSDEPTTKNNDPIIKDPGDTPDPNVFDANSTIITNDVRTWNDNNGDPVHASMGGHITKFGDTYYWVGSDPRKETVGYDIRLYSSKTLGSNSWTFEALIEDRPAGMDGRSNCTIIYNEKTDRYVIVTKGIAFYQSESNDIKGPYEFIRKVNANNKFNHPGFETGGMGTYYEGNDAYIIVSNLDRETRQRICGIWKLSDDFLNLVEEVLWLPTDMNREAYWLFVKDNKYYMTYDGPGGWMASDCYYRTADALAGPWSEEKDIIFDPAPANKFMRSHASQSRWMINVDGQWMYGGDRYPYHEPSSHPPEKGLYVWCPVIWNNGVPTVKFEKSWDIKNYPN